jgi:hypothetical protein
MLKLKRNKICTKGLRKKIEIKRIRIKLKKIIYHKLELKDEIKNE